ncbi:MAG TPA: TetR/AcrR family transcriptional regulator [Treponemataceae bacterium]|jgi:AcrR family transcriptional regulator|nr:TetR/AcrR family transcriptional regulator [Treponemataceae bacterium]
MKETFYNLNPEKQERVIAAAIAEFAHSGYEKTSLDSIVRRASISKGGLYEYIDSKDDLFLFALERAYGAMFDYILAHTGAAGLPPDPLERTRHISAIAVEFYLERPAEIDFIVRASRVGSVEVRGQVQETFDAYFARLYGDADFAHIAYGKDDVLPLLKWLLLKTRDDFHANVHTLERPAVCRDAYLAEWRFFLSILANGIYRA